jgi:hypothetical protein
MQQQHHKRLVVPLASAFLTLAHAHNNPHPWSDAAHTQTFLGTIKHWGNSYWLANTSEKVAARLDKSDLARHFLNKRVKITGTIDLHTNCIAMGSVAPLS